MNVEKISALQLKQNLDRDSSGTLLLDCRPFLAFNNDRILGAMNVFCPSILRRRFATKGYLCLDNLLSLDVRKKLKSGHFARVVLYENGEFDNHSVDRNGNSEIAIILQSLKRNNYPVKYASLLRGGFKKFKSEYPQWCTSFRCSMEENNSNCQSSTPSDIRMTSSENEPSELVPHLYIGDESHSVNKAILDRLGITAIVNVSTSCQNHFASDFAYKIIPVHDRNSENISSWFGEVIDFVEAVRRNHGKVLIHCKAGISRSATMCIAYLMYHKAMGLEEAFDFVSARRGVISPNANFMQQLNEFERVLLQKKADIMCPVVSRCSTDIFSVSNIRNNNACALAGSPTTSSFRNINACALSDSPTAPTFRNIGTCALSDDLSLPFVNPGFTLQPLRL